MFIYYVVVFGTGTIISYFTKSATGSNVLIYFLVYSNILSIPIISIYFFLYWLLVDKASLQSKALRHLPLKINNKS
ncbi:MAG: hypothetical protein RLZZ175_1247 [Bacteroidota bacterium]|jgi:hypothetical protein